MADLTSVVPSAAMLIIGDEILSGRTQERNLAYLATRLENVGIDLLEVRIVRDREAAIVAAINDLRHRYDYVFTSGGIGPTHDDITADSIAKAFDVAVAIDPRAQAMLLDYAAAKGHKPGPSFLRMARIPQGASLIDNPISCAPGFSIGNVHVMAGIPNIMAAMLENLLPFLKKGVPMQSMTIKFLGGESEIAQGLGLIQQHYPDIIIGSYPFQDKEGSGTHLILRGRDPLVLQKAYEDVASTAQALHKAGRARGWSLLGAGYK